MRPRGVAELLLPTLATGDAVDKELLPQSIRERRRAMKSTSSSSAGADELDESAVSLAESISSEPLLDPLPAMVEGREGDVERKDRGREWLRECG